MAEVKKSGAWRWLLWCGTILFVATVAFAGYTSYVRASVRPYKLLAGNLHGLQLSIERFAVDIEGSYPREPQELIDRGYLERWPENPFRPGEPMKLLRPGAPAEAGAFVYTGWGPIIAISNAGQQHHALNTAGVAEPPLLSDAQLTLSDIDQYVLVAYGPEVEQGLGSPPKAALRAELLPYESGKALLRNHPMADGIDWGRVVVVLADGEDYIRAISGHYFED